MGTKQNLDLTEDDLLGGTLRLRQPARGYRLTSDAVLLAALVQLRPGMRVLELGTGYGQVALCLLAREPSLHVTGVELMPQAAQLARENAALNGMVDLFTVIEGNITDLTLQGFDVVVSNPPYRQAQTHTASADPLKAAATTESLPLERWLAIAATALAPQGQLFLIHDARRESELLQACQQAELADVMLLPLQSKAEEAAKRIVVRARRGKAAITRVPALLLHAADGSWLPMAGEVLRQPRALALWPE